MLRPKAELVQMREILALQLPAMEPKFIPVKLDDPRSVLAVEICLIRRNDLGGNQYFALKVQNQNLFIRDEKGNVANDPAKVQLLFVSYDDMLTYSETKYITVKSIYDPSTTTSEK